MNTKEACLQNLGPFHKKVLAAIAGEDFNGLFDRYNFPTNAATEKIATKIGIDITDEIALQYVYCALKHVGRVIRSLKAESKR